eukprot:1414526-Amphidinium_carterae.2
MSRLDICYNTVRHITSVSAFTMFQELISQFETSSAHQHAAYNSAPVSVCESVVPPAASAVATHDYEEPANEGSKESKPPLRERLTTQAGGSYLAAWQAEVAAEPGDELMDMVRYPDLDC